MRPLTRLGVTAFAAVGLAVAGVGATVLVASPAQANPGDCVMALQNNGEYSSVRNVICNSTWTLTENVGPEDAMLYCVPAMEATGLDGESATFYCVQVTWE